MSKEHEHDRDELAKAVCRLSCAVLESLEWFKSQSIATKCDLRNTEHKIMSAISDFATKQNAFNDRIDTAVAGVTQDVQTLNDLIATLQNSPGTITPEDQASLDALQARGQAVADKLEALDALTPPPVPTA